MKWDRGDDDERVEVAKKPSFIIINFILFPFFVCELNLILVPRHIKYLPNGLEAHCPALTDNISIEYREKFCTCESLSTVLCASSSASFAHLILHFSLIFLFLQPKKPRPISPHINLKLLLAGWCSRSFIHFPPLLLWCVLCFFPSLTLWRLMLFHFYVFRVLLWRDHLLLSSVLERFSILFLQLFFFSFMKGNIFHFLMLCVLWSCHHRIWKQHSHMRISFMSTLSTPLVISAQRSLYLSYLDVLLEIQRECCATIISKVFVKVISHITYPLNWLCEKRMKRIMKNSRVCCWAIKQFESRHDSNSKLEWDEILFESVTYGANQAKGEKEISYHFSQSMREKILNCFLYSISNNHMYREWQ